MTTSSRLKPSKPLVLGLSVPLIILLISVSLTGLLYPEIYNGATPNWLAQTVGQDAIDLFVIVPLLIMSTLYTFANYRIAFYMWLGILVYLIYTFLIYCFAVRFNLFFIPYCLILGLSLFSLLSNFPGRSSSAREVANDKLLPIIGVYFIAVSVVFYALWLSEIVPAVLDSRSPESLGEVGLITNPVHVLDLSAFLPATFVIGLLTLRGKPVVLDWIPVFLMFFILMDITIAVLTIIMMTRVDGNIFIAVVMGSLALFTTALFVRLMGLPHYQS